jgi:adenosylcobinamide-GDP ribazoletransferase
MSMNGADWARARFAELVAAFALLTRLPVQLLLVSKPTELALAVWAYPIVGACVGAIGGAIFWIAVSFGFPPAIAAVYALAATVLATGALHEDGLVDAADGLAGKTREQSLIIMRDHQIGTYGAVALLLSLGLRAAALTLLAEPHVVMAALIATGAASRSSATALMAALPHARKDGLSVAAGRPSATTAVVAAALTLLIGLLLLPFGTTVGVLASALIAAAIVGCIALVRLGGQTGDVLGACCQLSECAGLTLIVALAA